MLNITSVKPSLFEASLRSSDKSNGSKSSIDFNSKDARPSISNIDQGTNIDQSISSRSMPNVHTSSNEKISDSKLDTLTFSGNEFSAVLPTLSRLRLRADAGSEVFGDGSCETVSFLRRGSLDLLGVLSESRRENRIRGRQRVSFEALPAAWLRENPDRGRY